MEGKIKLTNLQVLEELKATMGHENLATLGRQLQSHGYATYSDVTVRIARRTLVHAIVDCYCRIQGDATKRNLKQLQKKYMNGATAMDGEDLACKELIMKAYDAV